MEKLHRRPPHRGSSGYVGYEEGGQLTEKVRRQPYSVILFDEMEKAHPDVFNILLQILEDGRLTDGKGRTVDFRNAVIIMTSNVGASYLRRTTLGFGQSDQDSDYESMKERILEELKRTFRPEFLNRVDDYIVFHALNEEHISQIVDIMLKDLGRRMSEYNLSLEVSEEARKQLVKEGFDPTFGARPLRRVIQKRLEAGFPRALQGTSRPGTRSWWTLSMASSSLPAIKRPAERHKPTRAGERLALRPFFWAKSPLMYQYCQI